MNVLVACEKSGVVREAFRRRGHNAWSCDLEPASDNSPHHLQRDALQAIEDGPFENGRRSWDLVIAHPPCTRICNSGVLRIYRDGKKANGIDPAKWQEMVWGANFFREFFRRYDGPICAENPIMHGHARGIIGLNQVDRQTIQPHWFGDDASKATVLWLRGLPRLPLDPRKVVTGRLVEWPEGSGKTVRRWANQTDSGQNKLPPSADRGAKRAVTYKGIAEAMAETWGRARTQEFQLTA